MIDDIENGFDPANEIDPGEVKWRNIWSTGKPKFVGANGESPDTPYYLIRVFIITYNSPLSLHRNLESLGRLAVPIYENLPIRMEVNVINNHPNFVLDKKYCGLVRVLDNVMRYAYSCGHLARDSNTALILGFENLSAPMADQVIITHDDVDWHEDALIKLSEYHHEKGYTFYASDYGGSIMSFLPDAVKKIGIFDERYSNIGFHEADYFLRAAMYNREKSSINDVIQGRVLNPLPEIYNHPEYLSDKLESRGYSSLYHNISRNVFARKWNIHTDRWELNEILDNLPTHPLIETPIYYPYFEMDVEDLIDKKYMYAQGGYERHWYDQWSEDYSQTTTDPILPRIHIKLGPPKFQLAHPWQWTDGDREAGEFSKITNEYVYNTWNEPNWNSWDSEEPK